MPPEERDPASLWDMRQALARILRYTEGKTLAELSGDKLWGIVTDQVPSLLQRIDALLPPPPNV